MTNLTQKELLSIKGGVLKLAVGKICLVGGLISFMIGAVNGFLRPIACSSEK